MEIDVLPTGKKVGNALDETLKVGGGATTATTPTATIPRDDATTATAPTLLRLQRTSTGTPANGIGAGIDFEVETTAANNEIGAVIQAVTTDVTALSEDFDLVFRTMAAGAAAAERFKLNVNGATVTGGVLNLIDTNTAIDGAGNSWTFKYFGGTNVTISDSRIKQKVTGLYGWVVSTDTTQAVDTAIGRTSAGLVEINNGASGTWRDLKVRQHYVDQTVTAGGTTGAQTINKAAGTVNFAAAASTLVVTNNLVTTSSSIYCVVRTNDGTAAIKNVVPAAGSFTITLSSAATAETSVGFLVIN